MRVDDAVRVGVGNELAARRMHPDVARDAQALVGLADEAKLGKVHRDVGGAVARAVIDDDDFEIRVVEAAERFQAWAHRALGVVGANHDRHHRLVAGPGGQVPLSVTNGITSDARIMRTPSQS